MHEEDKYEKWFACFDFEAYHHDFDEKVNADEENLLEVEEGTSWNKVHVLVLFSIGCNVDGVEACHMWSKDPGELVSQFLVILLEMAEKKYRAAVEQFEYIFDQLKQLRVQKMNCLEESNLAGIPFPYCFAVPRSSMRCTHSKSEDQLPSESDDQQTFCGWS